MEQTVMVPEWLNVDFLNHCLQSNKDYLKCSVKNFKAMPAVPPGYNFGSNLLRVLINFKEESKPEERSLSLIVKSPLSASGHLFFDDFYSSEPKFYNLFLVEADKLQNNKKFTPISFSSPISSVVVLEDLKTKGYLMAERFRQLDFDHCCLYVTKAAFFHAVSFAVHNKNPTLVRDMSNEKMFSNDLKSIESTKNMIKYAIDYLTEKMLELKLNTNLIETLKQCSGTLWDMLVEAHKPNHTFNCLNQGDPWIANMMFTYESTGKPTDIKMLDFQNLRYATPLCDLTFFVWSSANHEVREHRLPELYQIYLDSLNSYLNELKCGQMLAQETFEKHLLELSPIAVWTVATNLPFMLNPEPTKDLSPLFEKLNRPFTPSDNPFKEVYFEGYTQTHLPRLIKQLQTTGVFDFLISKQVV